MPSWWIAALLLTASVQDSGYVERHVSDDGSLVLVRESNLRGGRVAFVDLVDETVRPAHDARIGRGVFDARALVGGRGDVLSAGSLLPTRRSRRRRLFDDRDAIVLVSSRGIWPAVVVSGRRMVLLDIECVPTTWDLEERWIRAGARPWAEPTWATLRHEDRELVIGDEAGHVMVCDLHRARWSIGTTADLIGALERTPLSEWVERLDWLLQHERLDEVRAHLAALVEPTADQAAVAFALGEPVDRSRRGAEAVVLTWKRSDGRLTESVLDAAQIGSWKHERLAASLVGAAGRDALERATSPEGGTSIPASRWLVRQFLDVPSVSDAARWPGRVRARLGLLRDEIIEGLPSRDGIRDRAQDADPGVVLLALDALEARLELEGDGWTGYRQACEALVRRQVPHRGLIAWQAVLVTGQLDPELLVEALAEELAAAGREGIREDVELLRAALVGSVQIDHGYDIDAWRAALADLGDR